MKLKPLLLALIILVGTTAVVPAQDEDVPTYNWQLSLSDRVIYIGQDLWVNVSGFPDRLFTLSFRHHQDNNYSFNQWGYTDSNGTYYMHMTS